MSGDGTSAESFGVEGKVIVITGASSGIGRAAAIELARQGATIAVVGRDPRRTEEVAALVGGEVFLADFARLDEVAGLAPRLLQRYERIDAIANNAGGLISRRTITADGFELTLQLNHLAPFLLTRLLLPCLIASEARVVSTASIAHLLGSIRPGSLAKIPRPYAGGWRAYGSSKLATMLFTKELARRTAGTGLTAYCLHPGYVSTGFGADSGLMKIAMLLSPTGFGITADSGAQPLVSLLATDVVPAPSGSYFDRFRPDGRRRRSAADPELAASLWLESENLLRRWLPPS